MKLRTRSNSVRLRLTQGEVTRLAREGNVEERIFVGPDDGGVLVYRIVSDEGAAGPGVALDGGALTVVIPRAEVLAWAESDAVGIERELAAPGGRTLSLLVEKDFACLKPRKGEDEGDAFPNPNDTC